MKTLLIALLCLISFERGGAEETPLHKLSVLGSSTLFKKPNQFNLRIAVVTQNAFVVKALQENQEKMIKIIESLRSLGLSEKEFQTGTFTIAPQYTLPPEHPSAEWSPSIATYRVENSLLIQTEQLPLAGQLLEVAVKNGANLIQNLSFSLKDTTQAQAEAIAQAVDQARLFASSAARQAGARLGPILELTVHPAYSSPRLMKMEMSLPQGGNTTPLIPQDVEITASVSVVFKIFS